MATDTLVPQWEIDGFAREPEVFVARGDEIVLRAFSANAKRNRAAAEAYVDPASWPDPYDRSRVVRRKAHGGSERDGACLFVPAFGNQAGAIQRGTIDMNGWTGAFLERHLNAFVWGNNYENIATFMLSPGTRYRIGPIGQVTRFVENWTGERASIARHHRPVDLQTPSTVFRQVAIEWPDVKRLRLIDENRILGLGALSPTRH